MNLELLQKPIIRIRLNVDQAKGPPTGKRWLVLFGEIHHLTASISYVLMQLQGSETGINATLGQIESAVASGANPLFNNLSNVETAQFSIFLLDDSHKLYFYGNGGVAADNCNADVWVVEF